jgi:pimeloyl-ACP methyl ester carboxylesterase
MLEFFGLASYNINLCGGRHSKMKKRKYILIAIASLVVFILTVFVYFKYFKYNGKVKDATLPEQLVFSKSSDDVLNAGLMFAPKKELAKPIAIIWVHGWGVNFYSPTYVSICRYLAADGYTCIDVNTRMHDLGNVEKYKGDQRIRGGGYWGIPSEEWKDIAAWVDFAEANGFKKVLLVGHSAGCSVVRDFQSRQQDNRVIGLVFGSGGVGDYSRNPIDSTMIKQAARLVSENKGETLVQDTTRSFPSYLSAASIMDGTHGTPEDGDFFGINHANAAVSRIRCPILAFYASDDIGNEKDLELLRSSIKKHSGGPISVTTRIINGTDHMYGGEEKQVASVITDWIEDISRRK